jgi:hypothetical protein
MSEENVELVRGILERWAEGNFVAGVADFDHTWFMWLDRPSLNPGCSLAPSASVNTCIAS